MFSCDHILSLINDKLDDENNLIIWKFFRPDKIIYPQDINNIKLGDIDTTSICFHSKFKNNSRWIDKQFSDFYFYNNLLKSNNFNLIFLPYIFTKTIYYDRISNYGENNDLI